MSSLERIAIALESIAAHLEAAHAPKPAPKPRERDGELDATLRSIFDATGVPTIAADRAALVKLRVNHSGTWVSLVASAITAYREKRILRNVQAAFVNRNLIAEAAALARRDAVINVDLWREQ